MEKNKIVIPVEIRVRELSAKLFLAAILADRGYDVYLGNKIQHTALDKISPDVYFETGARQQKSRLQMCQENGINTLILETEGQAWNGADEFATRIDKKTLKHTDCYCAWGNVAKEAVRKISPETRVELTGNPRFDLVQSPHRKIYQERANQLNERYGNYILFNTNFSVNGEYSIKRRDELTFDEDTSVVEENEDEYKKDVKIFGRMLEIIAETAENFPDYSVIVRPHPSENPDFYTNCFYAYDNIHIDKRFEVRPWIIGSEVVVHNSCTTGVESVLLNTPAIAYLPDGLEKKRLPNNISERCTRADDVINIIHHHINNGAEFTLDADSKSKVQSHIHNLDYLSAKRVADVVDSITSNRSRKGSLDVSYGLALRRVLVRIVGSKRFEELWVKRLRGEDRHKFEYIEKAEVDSIVEQFTDEIKPVGLEIDRVQYMVNGFRVYTPK